MRTRGPAKEQPLSKAPYSPNPKRYKTRHPAALAITRKEWNRIVGVFSKWDGRISLVATELGWRDERTRAIWNRGYPTLGYPPVKTILAKDVLSADEVRAARQRMKAKLPESEPIGSEVEIVAKAHVIAGSEARRVAHMVLMEEERAKARADAVEARSEEAMLISMNRKNTLALNGMTSRILTGAVALSAKIEQELAAEAGPDSKLTVQEKLGLMRSAAHVARFNSEATMLAVKAERMVMGQPIQALDEKVESGDLRETERWLESTMQLLQRAKERGALGSGDAAKEPEQEKLKESAE